MRPESFVCEGCSGACFEVGLKCECCRFVWESGYKDGFIGCVRGCGWVFLTVVLLNAAFMVFGETGIAAVWVGNTLNAVDIPPIVPHCVLLCRTTRGILRMEFVHVVLFEEVGLKGGAIRSFEHREMRRMAARAGIEPATNRLTADRSTAELPGNSEFQKLRKFG